MHGDFILNYSQNSEPANAAKWGWSPPALSRQSSWLRSGMRAGPRQPGAEGGGAPRRGPVQVLALLPSEPVGAQGGPWLRRSSAPRRVPSSCAPARPRLWRTLSFLAPVPSTLTSFLLPSIHSPEFCVALPRKCTRPSGSDAGLSHEEVSVLLSVEASRGLTILISLSRTG